MEEIQQQQQQLSKAEIYYQKQMARVRKYNENHREEMRERSRAYFKKMKADPEKYEQYKAKKRKEYKDANPKVVLPVKEFE